MLSRITAPFMLILMICQIGAAWTVFSTALWIHKQNKQARLSDEGHWEEFVISVADFESNLIEDDEIELDGMMYDIVFTEHVNGMIVLTAVADQAENKMKRTLNALQKEETGWSELTKRAQAFGMTVFCPEKSLKLDIRPFLITALSYFSYTENSFQKGIISILEEPPAN
jgi:hypothetical protein